MITTENKPSGITLNPVLNSVPVISAVIIFIIAISVMQLGYVMNIVAFREILPNLLVPMRFNTALCFACISLAIFSLRCLSWRLTSQLLFGFTLILSSLNMIELIFKVDIGIDELFHKDYISLTQKTKFPAGRMGASVATAFIFSAINGLFQVRSKNVKIIVQALPLLVFTLTLVNFLGYVYKWYPNGDSILISQMALHTVVCFVLLSISLLFLFPTNSLPSLLLAKDYLGKIFRKSILYIVLLPSIFSSLIFTLFNNEVISTGVSLVLFSVVYSALGLIAIWTYLDQIQKLDNQTQEADKTLQQQNLEISLINKELQETNELLINSNKELKESYHTMQEQTKTIENLLEDSLRLSEQKYKRLFQSQPLPLIIYRIDNHRILGVNEATIEKYGYTEAELLQLKFDDLLVNDSDKSQYNYTDDHHNHEIILRRLEGQKHLSKNGKIIYVDSISYEIEYDKIWVRVKIINDITEKIESETKYKKLADSIQSVFFEVDFNYNYSFLNSYSLNLVRMTNNEMIGKNLYETFSHYKGTEFERNLERCMIERIPIEIDVIDIFVDNTVRYYDTFFYPTPSGVAILSRDVTSQRLTEIELKENQQFINSIFKTVPSYIYLYNVVNDKVEYNNEGLLRSLGFSGDELKPLQYNQIQSLIHVEDLPFIKNAINELSKSGKGQIIENEYRLKNNNGDYHWVQDRTVSYSYDTNGNLTHILGTITSIDQAKRYQIKLMQAKALAEEANIAKTNFLANMSHELRNPLNALLGITQLLERDYAHDTKISQYVGLMRQSSNRLLNTIGDVLDLTKIEHNKITLNPTKVHLNLMIARAVDVYLPLAAKKGLVLEFANLLQPERVALLDEKLFEQVLHNLISNAIKFTSHGGIYISISNCTIDNRAFHCIHIKDTGIGMSDEFIVKRLFGTFEQESAGMRKTYDGSGLGLHIAKRFIDLMGGEISVKSERSIGTTFTVSFPI